MSSHFNHFSQFCLFRCEVVVLALSNSALVLLQILTWLRHHCHHCLQPSNMCDALTHTLSGVVLTVGIDLLLHPGPADR